MWANASDVVHRTLSRGGRDHRAAVDFVVCFGCGGISCLFFRFYSSNAHGRLKYEATLPHLPLYYLVVLIARAVRTKSISTNKPGVYGSGQVWANAWDVFRRKPCRGGRGRRDAVDDVMCSGCGGISCFFSRFFSRFFFFFPSNAHGLLQV